MSIPASARTAARYTATVMRLSFEWLVLLGAAVVGCSPAPAPVASSMHDPSNPAAPESVDPIGHVQTGATTSTADAGPVVYVCPMHAEISSDRPGSCPKCGMMMVPKK